VDLDFWFAKKNVAAVVVIYVMVVPIATDHMGVVLPNALASAELLRQSISLDLVVYTSLPSFSRCIACALSIP
jgi:hypothetical protein